MADYWVIEPGTGVAGRVSDDSVDAFRKEGWQVRPYMHQDAGVSVTASGQYVIDPANALARQQALDELSAEDRRINRYGQDINAYQAVTGAQSAGQNAATQRLGALGQFGQYLESLRGPADYFQFSNNMHGAPNASGLQVLNMLAGQAGNVGVGPIDQSALHSLTAGDIGLGGVSKAVSTWAQQNAMPQAAAQQNTLQTQQAGRQQAAPPVMGNSPTDGQQAGLRSNAPSAQRQALDARNAARAQAGWAAGAGLNSPQTLGVAGNSSPAGDQPLQRYAPEMGRLVDNRPGGRTGQVYSPEMGRWVDGPASSLTAAAPTAADSTTFSPAVQNGAGAAFLHPTPYGPSQAVYASNGKVDTGAYERLGGDISNRGDSKIAHVNASHNLIRAYGYGHGSDARNAAHKAAGMTGEEFDRVIKHGGDPFKQRTVAAAGGTVSVVTKPTTLVMGEHGGDELHIVIPLENPKVPAPQWATNLANSLSPDKDGKRADPAVRMAQGGMAASLPMQGMEQGPQDGMADMQGMPMAAASGNLPHNLPPNLPHNLPLSAASLMAPRGMDAGMGDGFDPQNPEQPPEDLARIAAVLADPHSPDPQADAVRQCWRMGADGTPQYVHMTQKLPQPSDGGPIHLAQGGLVYGPISPTATVTNPIGKPNSAGQVRIPTGARARPTLVPVGTTVPYAEATRTSPTARSLMAPADVKLLSSYLDSSGDDLENWLYRAQFGVPARARIPVAGAWSRGTW